MISNFVTAAKGLFKRQESQDALADPAANSTATTPEMVTTKRGDIAPQDAAQDQKTNGLAKGKRKAQPVNTEKPSDKQSKRRKRNSLEAAAASDDEPTLDDSEKQAKDGDKKQEPTGEDPKKHFRFGSEEPAMPAESQPEEPTEAPSDGEDSDDDAPEAIDNSAQLIKMKEQAKRQEKLKQQEDSLRREKRRKLDERRKSQAKSSKSKDVSAPIDDLISESTTTLQGSTTQDARRRALPALLPDDILNAEPVVRPPTPPAEDAFGAPKKPSKLRFLDKTEKAPKDVRAGGVAIRVLDVPFTKQKSKPALAPKASKSGRNLKEDWLKREKSTARVNGLRRTTGSSSGFVRR